MNVDFLNLCDGYVTLQDPNFVTYVYSFISFKYVLVCMGAFFWSNDWLIQACAVKWKYNADFKTTHNKSHTEHSEAYPWH